MIFSSAELRLTAPRTIHDDEEPTPANAMTLLNNGVRTYAILFDFISSAGLGFEATVAVVVFKHPTFCVTDLPRKRSSLLKCARSDRSSLKVSCFELKTLAT